MLRHEGQPTLCVYKGTGEGRLRSPSNPRPLAPLPEHRTNGAQPPDPHAGARTAQRRTAVVVHLAQAKRVALDRAAEALRPPNAGKRVHEAASGVRELSPDVRVPFEDRAAHGG